MNTRKLTVILPMFASLAMGYACGGRQDRSEEPSSETMMPAAGPATDRPRASSAEDQGSKRSTVVMMTGVAIERSLAEACGVAMPATFFEFDSSNLQAPAPNTLDEIAECLKSGPLQGEEIMLVGRTDPRGTDQYNMELGMSRAEAVAQYLERQGVSRDRLRVDSIGEREALEIPQTYAIERRVDIRRADATAESGAGETPSGATGGGTSESGRSGVGEPKSSQSGVSGSVQWKAGQSPSDQSQKGGQKGTGTGQSPTGQSRSGGTMSGQGEPSD